MPELEGHAKVDYTSELIQTLVASIAQRGLVTPAIVLLELLRPFTFVGSQALLLIQPLLGPSATVSTRRYAELLEHPRHLDRLLGELEGQRHAAPTEGGS